MKKLLLTFMVLIGMLIAGTMLSTATSVMAASSDGLATDMYMKIYDDVANKPAQAALKTSAKKFSMSPDDMQKIAVEGDISALIKKPSEDMSDVINKYSKINASYQNALATENLRADLNNKANPSEVYTDGDTSNSEFDILYDLTVIEIILFNEASVSEFGGQFALPNFNFSDPDEAEFIDELLGNKEVEATTTGEKDFSSIECLDDDSALENALNNFESGQQGTGGGDDDDDDEVVYGEDGFPQAEPGDWPVKYLCPDGAFFCVEIGFDDKSTKIYSKKDNCIACHIQNTNKAMDEMLGKPISPNKMPGNIMEVNKCKSAFTNIGANMNIITIAVPPPKQANQDMYKKVDIDKEWQTYKEQYDPLKFDVGKNPQSPPNTIEDRASKKSLTNAGPFGTLDEVFTSAEEKITGTENQQREDQARRSQEIKTEVQNREFKTIIEELSAFHLYFNSIKELFDKMKEPCSELSNKAYCT